MVKNIAVIGDSESIKGFGAVGIDMFICDEPLESGSLFNAEKIIPAVIPIPSAQGSSGAGRKRLSKFVEQAVGSDILFGN